MKRIFLILAVILILLTGCNNSTELSDTPTESTPAIVITETVTTPTTENEDPKGTTDNADAASSFSASKETEMTEVEETASKPKPSATTEQLAKTEQAEENFNRTPSANVTSNVSKCIKNNIANEKEIAIKISEKINELRYLAGDGNMEFLNGLSEYAKYRSEQIVFDFSHNTTAQREAATTLQYGKGYYLVEVEAPFGYVLDTTPVYFDVTEDNSTKESGITVIKVNKANIAQKGTITVTKQGEVFSSVTEQDGVYQPVYEIKGLAGAVADFDKVRITFYNGDSVDYTCRYIDEYHVEVGSNLYHICQFAEIMQRNGNTVIPLRASLPETCYSTLANTGKIVIIKRGESGYYPTDIPAKDLAEAKEIVDEMNEKGGVSKAQAEAMKVGSMFGWATPAADPASYDKNGKLIPPNRNGRGDER